MTAAATRALQLPGSLCHEALVGNTITYFLSSCLPQSENASEEAGEGEYVNLYSSGQSNGELPRSEGVSKSWRAPEGLPGACRAHAGAHALGTSLSCTPTLELPAHPAAPAPQPPLCSPTGLVQRQEVLLGSHSPGRSQGWLLLPRSILCALLAVWSCLRGVPLQRAAPCAILGPHLFL